MNIEKVLQSINSQIDRQLSDHGMTRTDIINWSRDAGVLGRIRAKVDDSSGIFIYIEGVEERKILPEIVPLSHKRYSIQED